MRVRVAHTELLLTRSGSSPMAAPAGIAKIKNLCSSDNTAEPERNSPRSWENRQTPTWQTAQRFPPPPGEQSEETETARKVEWGFPALPGPCVPLPVPLCRGRCPRAWRAAQSCGPACWPSPREGTEFLFCGAGVACWTGACARAQSTGAPVADLTRMHCHVVLGVAVHADILQGELCSF